MEVLQTKLSLSKDEVAYPLTCPSPCKNLTFFASNFLIFLMLLFFQMLVRQRSHENKTNLIEHEEMVHFSMPDWPQAWRFIIQSLKVRSVFGSTYQAFEHNHAHLRNSRVDPCRGFWNHFAFEWFTEILHFALEKFFLLQYLDLKTPASMAANLDASACFQVSLATS